MKKRILSLVMALVLAIGLLPMSALAAGSSSENWTISVETYDADGNGTYLLEPTVVDYYYYKNWVPGILNYYWGNDYSKVEYDSHRNEYYITKIADDSQEDGWLDNGDLGENSKWKIVWNGTVLADKPSGCYASRGAVIRYIFFAEGDAAEAGVNKDALLQALADLTDAQKETLGTLYTTARTAALNPEATEAEVTNAFTALKAALVTPATGITLSSESVNLIEGNSATVTATLTPTNTTDSVSWSIDNTDVATVDENGKVTAVSAGTATLTARANDTVSATAAITVTKETRYVYFAYADGKTQEMAEDGSFTLSSLDQGYFRVGGTDATAWWENEEVIDAGQGSVTYHWYVNRETGEWQPSGQAPTKPIVVTAGDFTKSFTINYEPTSGITALKTYIDGTEVTDDDPYEVTGCVSNVPVTTKGLKDGVWIDIPVQALNYDTSDNIYYNFRFIGNCLEINRAGSATMTVSLKGEDVSTTFGVVCKPVLATAMKVIVPETFAISDWDANGYYVGLRPFSEGGYSIEFTPANATNRDVTWTALDPEIAEHFTTHSAGIVPKKAGTATFTVTNTLNPELTQDVEITFTYKNPLTRASVDDLTMAPGTEQALNISVSPENATEQRFDWTYSRNGIVEVSDEIKTSEDGQSHWTTHSIKALHSGTVTVTGTPWDQTGGCEPVVFTVTVTGDSFLATRNVTVKAGDTVTYTDETGDYTGSADLSGLDTGVAEVELKALTSTGSVGWLGSNASYNESSVDLADCLYTFTKTGDTWTITGTDAEGNTVYLYPGNGKNVAGGDRSSGYPNTASVPEGMTISITPGSETGSFNIYSNVNAWDNGNGAYLYFNRGSYRWDRVETIGTNATFQTNCSLYLYRAAGEDETSSDEIPGYVRVTSVSDLTDGGKYLIAAPGGSSYYVAYPNTSTDNLYCQIARVGTGTTTSTEITITGVGAGKTSFIAGETEYIIRVPGPSDSLTAEWPSFRGNDQNNGVTSAKTPRTAGEAELNWAANDGAAKDSWGFYLPTSYIMADGMIITASGDKLSQIDPATGELVQSVTMAGSRGYAYMSPVYGDGMIFVPLEGGMVQAFDAQTLESKWIYTDEKGGQPLSAIVYDDGYLYTGFGNDWTAAPSTERNWVCIPAEDTDPTSTSEAQEASWTYSHAGGFYWSGAYAAGDYLVVGGEKTGDKENLYVFDKTTGELTDSIAVDGNIRCTISAYGDSAIAFVTQGGSFYTGQISGEGKLALSEPVTIGGQSTSTPVVVNGYAYIGVCSTTYTYHIAQIKLSDGTVKTVDTAAYPQSSLLASTGYGDKTYLYFTCNGTPGGVQVLEVSANGAMSLSDLYVPEESQQNYCLASLMCDPQGTLYYSNDSGYLFAVSTWSASSCPVTFQTTPADAAVAVKDSNGSPVSAARDGVYDLTAGTYTYTVTSGDKSKSGTLVITADDAANHTPQTVTVSLSSSQSGGGSSSSGSEGTITVSIRVADPKGETYLEKTSYTLSSGSTVYDLLVETGLSIKSTNSSFGVYIQSIEGLGELDEGQYSGWMYRVNGTYPDVSCSAQTLKSGDYVEWLYTRDLGTDIGGSGGGAAVSPADQAAADKVAELIAAIGTVTDASGDKIAAARTAYDALTAAQKKLVSNYAVLTAAEQAYGQLTGAEGLPFTDVAGHWALDAIRYVYEQGLMTGTTAATFSPEKAITRGMIAAILYRLEGSPDVSGGVTFSDVDSGKYYASAIQWAQANGIVEGYTSGRFGPDDPITREQLAVILYRYAAYKKLDLSASADLSGFADQDQISDYAADALSWANAAGLITGTKADTLSPRGSATRAQAAAILMRFLENTGA